MSDVKTQKVENEFPAGLVEGIGTVKEMVSKNESNDEELTAVTGYLDNLMNGIETAAQEQEDFMPYLDLDLSKTEVLPGRFFNWGYARSAEQFVEEFKGFLASGEDDFVPTGAVRLSGRVFGDSRFKDYSRITTSPVVEIAACGHLEMAVLPSGGFMNLDKRKRVFRITTLTGSSYYFMRDWFLPADF